jgi:hypothetical protein
MNDPREDVPTPTGNLPPLREPLTRLSCGEVERVWAKIGRRFWGGTHTSTAGGPQDFTVPFLWGKELIFHIQFDIELMSRPPGLLLP